jgi:predicted flap endonuclease-1-like 5' DNA nuclease
MLLDEVDELLEAAESETNDSSEAQQDPTGGITDPDPSAPVDRSTDIQANELSEWYDAVRNLAEVTVAIKNGVSDVDAPMRDWCEAVGQFAANGGERHPAYGKLQMEHNRFSMSDYREVYGNGERTTEFHFVEVEPLTKTVHTILQRVSGRSMDEVYLPVAPASKVRLPVIVETPDELQRAVGLLEEFPTQLEPAAPVEDEGTDESPSGVDTEGSPGTEAETGTTDKDTDDTEESDHDEGGGATSGDGNPPLTDLGGVTPQVAEALRRAGITSREQLVSTDMDELAGIDGVGKAIAQRIKMQVG